MEKESQDVTEKLKTLRGLAEDDMSEVSLLKCRIEQQAELIYILKQRADEYLKKYMEIENKTGSIETGLADFAMKYENEKKSHELLRDRFDTLEHNHKQLIKIKDEYKKENGSLRKENERLKTVNDNLFSEAIEEKDGIISKLNKDLLELHSKLEDAGKREKDFEKQLDAIRREMEQDIVQLKFSLEHERSTNQGKLEEMERELSMAQTELASSKYAMEESDKKAIMYEETKSFLEKRYMEVQKQTNELLKQLDGEKEKVRVLEQRLRKEIESTSINSTIRRLSAEVEEEKRLKVKLVREFEAFKKHSSSLLNRERELNTKLRMLNIP